MSHRRRCLRGVFSSSHYDAALDSSLAISGPMTRYLLLLACLTHGSAAALSTPVVGVGRRVALRAGAAAVLSPLFVAATASAITDYAKKDFKDGKYVGPSTTGAAPTLEGEEKFQALYDEAILKKEKTVKDLGFDLDDEDRFETEMMLRTQYCGFQAKLKCKASPAAKNGGR